VHARKGLDAVDEAQRLREQRVSIHYHTFIPTDIIRLLSFVGDDRWGLSVLEGPVMSPESDEFHVLVRKTPFSSGSSWAHRAHGAPACSTIDATPGAAAIQNSPS
jgi:hypothetical protein